MTHYNGREEKKHWTKMRLWSQSRNLDVKRKFGRSKIRVVHHNVRSLSTLTAQAYTFEHSPFLHCVAVHLNESKIMYIYRPNGRNISVNLGPRPKGHSKIRFVARNFEPSKSMVKLL